VVITKRKMVGVIFDDEIWQMKDVEIIPFPKNTMHLTESQVLYIILYYQGMWDVLLTVYMGQSDY